MYDQLSSCSVHIRRHLITAFDIKWSPTCTYSLKVDDTWISSGLSLSSCAGVSRTKLSGKGWVSEAWRVDEIHYDLGAATDSPVTFDAEASFVDEHPGDWDDRIQDSFNMLNDQNLWASPYINIDLEIHALRSWSYDIGNGTSCLAKKGAYQLWLAGSGGGPSHKNGADAYQLWTANDYDGCQGGATGNSAGESNPVSFIEVWECFLGDEFNPTCDYDARDTDERALIAGQELGHVYGEELHDENYRSPSACGGPCSIMSSCGEVDGRDFYFLDASMAEIRYHYFYGQGFGSSESEMSASC